MLFVPAGAKVSGAVGFEAGPGGGEVLPIRYSRNDVSLFPGESTTVSARYRSTDLGGAAPGLTLSGFNVPEQTFSVG